MWKVSTKRPEDEHTAKQFYSKASIYEKNVMRTMQRRILLRALELALISFGAKVLDAGCGTGFGLELLKELGYEAVGIDVSPEMVRIAKSKHFNARVSDMRKLPFKAKSFEAIVSISALQWVQEAEIHKVAAEFWRVLKQGGIAVLQFYPRSEEEMMAAATSFRQAGFKVRIQIDSENKPRKRKIFLLLRKE